MDNMRGLLIKREFLELIFAGKKTWEIRGSRSQIRGLIALIESATGTVVGTCTLDEVVGPLTLKDMQANAKRIGCKAEDITSKYYKNTYAWVLGNVVRLPRPVPYKHPSGAVIWVRLYPAVVNKVQT